MQPDAGAAGSGVVAKCFDESTTGELELSVSPDPVRAGTDAQLVGGLFSSSPGLNSVCFGGEPATVLAASGTILTVSVPRDIPGLATDFDTPTGVVVELLVNGGAAHTEVGVLPPDPEQPVISEILPSTIVLGADVPVPFVVRGMRVTEPAAQHVLHVAELNLSIPLRVDGDELSGEFPQEFAGRPPQGSSRGVLARVRLDERESSALPLTLERAVVED